MSASDSTEANHNLEDKYESAPEGIDAAAADLNANQPWHAYIGIITMCVLIAFGGYVFGFDTGTIPGFVNMTDFQRRFGSPRGDGTYYFSNARTGMMIGLFNAGCAIGALFLSKLADLYGRRFAISVSMLIYISGVIVQIAAQHAWYQVMIGRIVTGVAVGTLSVVCPLFISEVSPKHLRGTLVVCFQLMITLGIFLGYCTTYGTKVYSDSRQWRVPLGLCFAWALFLIGGMTRMPESPRYLLSKDKIDDARIALAKVNKASQKTQLYLLNYNYFKLVLKEKD